jgi:hypothetical protein
MIHPHTEVRFISPEKGYGIIALKRIPKGTITWCVDPLDRVISKTEMENMSQPWRMVAETYAYRNAHGDYILCWDTAKYINHSFKSNCLTTPFEYEIAVRDIEQGEELTDDYGYLNIESPFRGIPEGTRRKTVYPDDLLRYGEKWDKQVLAALTLLRTVEQPLREFLSDEIWERTQRIIDGDEIMPSLKTLYYPRP